MDNHQQCPRSRGYSHGLEYLAQVPSAPSSSQYQQATGSQYQHPTGNQYQQPTGTQYQQPTGNQYQQPSGTQYPQPTGNQYQQPTGSQYQQPTGSQYQQLTANQCQQQDYIPYRSTDEYQCRPPIQNAFQNSTLSAGPLDQSLTPHAFHSQVHHPPSDFSSSPRFSHPPPSMRSHVKSPLEVNIEEQTRMGGVPPSQNNVNYTAYPRPSCGLPPPPLFGVHNQPSLETSKEFSNVNRYTSSVPGFIEESTKSEDLDDQTWLQNFEQNILRSTSRQTSIQIPIVPAKRKPLKLKEVQQMVRQSQRLTEKLRQIKKKMSLVSNDGSSDGMWTQMVHEAEKIKVELSDITHQFQDKYFLEDVTHLIQKRRKQRERTRRANKLKLKQKRELKESRKREEERIDAWMMKLRLKEEEKRREIALKKEADGVLCEVRQKQVDAVKMQQLLENLISLRIVRLNKGEAQGYISTPQQDHIFNVTLKNISEVVNAQMEEYKLEEQTLCVMMEESTTYQRSNAGKESRDVNKLEASLKKVFFGNAKPIDQDTYDEFTAADRSLETLIQRRKEWDQFICEEDAFMASSIPLTWVVPPAEPSDSWKQYQ